MTNGSLRTTGTWSGEGQISCERTFKCFLTYYLPVAGLVYGVGSNMVLLWEVCIDFCEGLTTHPGMKCAEQPSRFGLLCLGTSLKINFSHFFLMLGSFGRQCRVADVILQPGIAVFDEFISQIHADWLICCLMWRNVV